MPCHGEKVSHSPPLRHKQKRPEQYRSTTAEPREVAIYDQLSPATRHHRVHGYILGGGQSSRMGTDKALLRFGTGTLLDRATSLLAPLCADLCLLGPARPGYPTLRSIPDRIALAGPVAAIEAALTDLHTQAAVWALFLPVDVPLLPPGLLAALLTLWLARPSLRMAFPVVEGRAQPVISLVHVSALPTLRRALDTGQHRLRVVLEAAAEDLATHGSLPRNEVLFTPTLTVAETRVFADGEPLPWQPSPAELARAPLWFANANTPPELEALRRSL